MSHLVLKTYGLTATSGMDIDKTAMTIPNICHGCEAGKSARKPFLSSGKRTSQILEVIHSDLAGPIQCSIQGSTYTATFVDDHSRHAVVYYLCLKDQFVQALKAFLAWTETQKSCKVRALHLDRGGEYMANSVAKILSEKGIEQHLTMPGSPQQNGKAERFNCTIMDKAMAMLHDAGLLSGFWEYAVDTAVHVSNRTPTRVLKWQTPYEVWNSGQIPDVSHFRIFGCRAYIHVPDDKCRKLDAKALEVTLVWYELGAKGYRLWDNHTHSVKLSWDVTFDESVFPSWQSVEPHPAPVSVQAPTFTSPAPAELNLPAMPPVIPPAQAPLRDSSDSD